MNLLSELKINQNDSKETLEDKFSILAENDKRFKAIKRFVMLNQIQIKLGDKTEIMQVILYEY